MLALLGGIGQPKELLLFLCVQCLALDSTHPVPLVTDEGVPGPRGWGERSDGCSGSWLLL